jgi:hypothetical protein
MGWGPRGRGRCFASLRPVQGTGLSLLSRCSIAGSAFFCRKNWVRKISRCVSRGEAHRSGGDASVPEAEQNLSRRAGRQQTGRRVVRVWETKIETSFQLRPMVHSVLQGVCIARAFEGARRLRVAEVSAGFCVSATLHTKLYFGQRKKCETRLISCCCEMAPPFRVG